MRVRSMLFAVAIIVLLLPHSSKGQTWKELMSSADSLNRFGRPDSALVTANRALPIAQSQLGLLDTNVADILYDVGRYTPNWGGHEYWQKALQIREKLLPKTHPKIAANLRTLAAVEMNNGNYRAAETLIRQALEILQFNYGPYHAQCRIARMILSNCLVSLGEFAAAEEQCRSGLKNLEDSEVWMRGQFLMRLARWNLAQLSGMPFRSTYEAKQISLESCNKFPSQPTTSKPRFTNPDYSCPANHIIRERQLTKQLLTSRLIGWPANR